jgi:hypothetical protein
VLFSFSAPRLLVQNLPALLCQPVLLLAAARLVRDGALNPACKQKRLQVRLQKVNAVFQPGGCLQFREGTG